MPINFVTVPDDYATAALNHFNQIKLPPEDLEYFRGSNAGPYVVSTPHILYDLDIATIDQMNGVINKFSDFVTPSALTYFVSGAKGPVAAVHLPLLSQSGMKPIVTFGPHLKSMPQTLRRLANHPVVIPQPYELRVFRSVINFLMAVWLRHEREGEDLIIPLEPTTRGLTAQKIYTITEFGPIMLELVRARCMEQKQASDSNRT